MNAELVYTGITRAKEILYILSNSTKFNEFAKIFKRDGDKILVDLQTKYDYKSSYNYTKNKKG